MEIESKEFRVSFQKMFFIMSLNILPLFGILLAILFWIATPESIFRLALTNLGLALIIIAVGSYLLCRTPRIYVSEEEIKAHNRRGQLTDLAWGSIDQIRYQNRLGVKYIFVKNDESEVELVLPLFIDDLDDFQQQVENFAGATHPLTEKLKDI